jgi:hypothetical protein
LLFWTQRPDEQKLTSADLRRSRSIFTYWTDFDTNFASCNLVSSFDLQICLFASFAPHKKGHLTARNSPQIVS